MITIIRQLTIQADSENILRRLFAKIPNDYMQLLEAEKIGYQAETPNICTIEIEADINVTFANHCQDPIFIMAAVTETIEDLEKVRERLYKIMSGYSYLTEAEKQMLEK